MLDYRTALDNAAKAAGRGDSGWNGRYRAGLADNGLMLSNVMGNHDDYCAPAPYAGPGGWPHDPQSNTYTYVVWASLGFPAV